MSYPFFRNLLFHLDSENAHHITMGLASTSFRFAPIANAIESRYTVSSNLLQQTITGIRFDNPVGLAAGFDKNAQFLDILPRFGFGAIEIGTVTAQAQPGNPRPRLFRLPDDLALLNRMGFNNHGAEVVANRLLKRPHEHPAYRLGINIGKTKVVPIDAAADDYLSSFTLLFDFADYVVVNVSSPNTPGLRQLQERDHLHHLIGSLQTQNVELARQRRTEVKPLFIKLAPDLEFDPLLEVVEVAQKNRVDGLIATNTTISRQNLTSPNVSQLGDGGISGRPLHQRSLEVIRFLHQNAPELVIIGVGGIFNSEDALRTIRAGASLLQVYTGFIYEGPGIVREINRGLIRACRRHGWSNISDAIGIDSTP